MSKNNNLFKNNFIYLRNVFSEIEIKKLKKKIFEDLKYKDLKDRTSHSNANILIKEDFYWDIFKKKEIIDGAKKILLNNNICFIPHTDVQINSKGGIFHRDSAARNFPYGHVWNEVDAKYGVLRVAIYLSSYKDSNSSLLLLKNTNYKENVFQRIETKIYNKLRTFFNKMNLQLPHFSLLSNLVKIKFNPGDVVVFDQRIIHCCNLSSEVNSKQSTNCRLNILPFFSKLLCFTVFGRGAKPPHFSVIACTSSCSHGIT